CPVDRFAEKRFRPIFQLTQNERGNFRRRKDFFAEPHANHVAAGWIETERKELQFVLDVLYTAAHQTFDRVDGAFGLRKEAAASSFSTPATRLRMYERRFSRSFMRANSFLRAAASALASTVVSHSFATD